MRPWRILYIVVLIASLSFAYLSYWKFRMKEQELILNQQLVDLSNEAFSAVNAKLEESKFELERYIREIEELNKNITILEKEKDEYRDELQVLKEERERLKINVARLTQEKRALEEGLSSLEELKRALKIAQTGQRVKTKEDIIRERKAKMEMLKALDRIALQEGNRGFLVKSGESTFKPRTRVRVELEPLK